MTRRTTHPPALSRLSLDALLIKRNAARRYYDQCIEDYGEAHKHTQAAKKALDNIQAAIRAKEAGNAA